MFLFQSTKKKGMTWQRLLLLLILSLMLPLSTAVTLNAATTDRSINESLPKTSNKPTLSPERPTNKPFLQTQDDFPLSGFSSWVSKDGDYTVSVAWGDVDGDGDLDLATGNANRFDLSCFCYIGGINKLYLNENGTLQTSVAWSSTDKSSTQSMAWGDIDGDGDLDLAAGNSDGTNKIYFNENGMLQTSAAWTSQDSDATQSVAWGDIDGDGDLDLAAGNSNGANKIYFNENGVLQTSAAWTSQDSDATQSVAWGDIDNDGDLDLAVGNGGYLGQPNKIYINDNGVLQTAANNPWESDDSDATQSIAWGDFDSDGDLDLAAGNLGQTDKLYLNENGILQTVATWSSDVNDDTSSIAWGDVDGDGDLDLAAANWNGANKIYLNENGVLQTSAIWSSVDTNATQSIAWGDVDGDGDLDLAAGNEDNPNRLYLNENGVLQTDPNWTLEDNSWTQSIAWGDVDGDGDLDLAIGNEPAWVSSQNLDGTNKLYLNENGVLQTVSVWSSTDNNSTGSIAWGDVDGDGDLDLATGDSPTHDDDCNCFLGGGNKLYLNENKTLQMTATWTSDDSDETQSVAWGDVDGDSDLDLAVGNYGAVNKLYLNNNGALQTTAAWSSDDNDDTYSVAWGDVDGDGDLDLAVGNYREANKLYLNENGVLQTAAAWSSDDNDETNSIAWGDVDGDGDLDLAAGNYGEANKLYLNENGILQVVAIWSSADSYDTNSIAWGDVDGDGDLDLATGNGVYNNGQPNKIYLNEGGILQTAADNSWTSEDNEWTQSIAWGDIDGDGDLDLITGNAPWWNGSEYIGGANKLYLNGKGNHDLPMNAPFLTASRPLTPATTNFYVPPQIISDDIIPISYKLFDYEGDAVGQIKAEYSLNGGGQWFPATATQDTITTNLATSAWPAGTEHIYYWDTFASGFFGQSDNVVFRIEAYPQPASSAANGTYQYTNLTPFPIQRPYASATTFPFRVRGTQVQVFSETISAENAVPDAVVYQQSDGSLGEPMSGADSSQPFTTDSNGYLSGRGQLDIGDQLFAALPVTTTYRTPPQLIWNGSGTAKVTLNNAPSSAFTAEFWLLPTADDGELFTLGGLTLSHPLDLTINGQSTGVSIGDGFPHHVALTWQDSNNAWNLIVDGESKANGVTDISLDDSLSLGDGYSGSLDEIRLWNTVRSSTQISETLFTPLSGKEAGLIGYWPVEANDANSVQDYSGNANNLVLSGDVAVYYKPLYTVYHTSGAPTPSGVEMFEVTEPGVQQLVVSKDNPLVLFDLDVSLEWDATGDESYLEQLDRDIKRASEVLYDLTNGQVAFGSINVYQDKELWNQADIQVYANNNQRPNANLGGIVTNYLTDTLKTGEVVGNAFLPGKIRIGATWNRYGNPGGTVGEDWPRVLAHEFGHYGLFLLDNYLGVEEVDGSKIIVEVDCAGSAMTDAYRQDYSEFLGLLTNSAGHSWLSSGCQKTLAEDTTGRSDWETIRHFYPFLKENIVSTQAGPTTLPLAVTQVTIHEPTNGQELLTTPVFYINDTNGNLIPFTRGEGQAYLYQSNGTADPEDDDVLYLGSPSGPLINARGAAVGDRLCVFDNGHTPPRIGCLDDLQNSGATLTLIEAPIWQPEITVRPVNSTTLAVTVTQSSVSNIHIQLFPSYRPTETIKALTAQLVHQGNGVYTGEFQFPITIFDGFIRVWEEGNANHESVSRFANAPGWDGNTFVGFGGNRFIAWGGNRFIAWGGNTFVGFGGNRFIAWGGNTFVGFGGNTFVGFGGNRFVGFGGNTFVGFNAPLASPDGQVILYNVDNILAGNVAASLQVLPSVPDLPTWLTPIGQVYRYTTQENEGDNLVIQFQYLQRELPAIDEEQLRIYYLDESDPAADWQRIENTTIDDFRNLASAKMPGEGLYALIATIELPNLYVGWNIFSYPSVPVRPVAEALASLDPQVYGCDTYCYTSVYQYHPLNGWLLYDQTVPAPYDTHVNTLELLQPLNSYWIYATRPMIPYIQPGTAADIHSTPELPPATYYGTVAPSTGFAPQVGDAVEARVNGGLCGTGEVINSTIGLIYVVQVKADNGDDCGAAEREVIFTIDGQTMPHTAVWDNAVACFHPLDFSATAPTACEAPSSLTAIYLPMITQP